MTSSTSQKRTHRLPDTGVLQKKYRVWNVWIAIAYVLQSVGILLASTSVSTPVYGNFLTTDALAGSAAGQTVWTAARNHLFDVNLTAAVALFLLISAVSHIVIAYFLRRHYEQAIETGIYRWRWLEYTISNGIVTMVIAAVCGITDLAVYVLLFGLHAIACLLAWVVERTALLSAKPSRLVYGIACLAGALPWLVMGMYVWAAHVFGAENMPAYIYAALAVAAVGSAGFAITMYLHYYKNIAALKSYATTDFVYSLLSFLLKSIVAWILFAGVLQP
jgi:hypothetical protein